MVREKLDDHHVFHYKRYWEEYTPSAQIRRAVIAHRMSRSVHNLLHEECPAVPPLSYEVVSHIARDMDRHYEDPLQGIDDFCLAAEAAFEHPKIKRGEIMLGQLAIESVRMQIPFIIEGTENTRRLIVAS